MQPASPLTMTDEARHNLALWRLYQAAIRKGAEIEEQETANAADAGELGAAFETEEKTNEQPVLTPQL